MAGKEPTKWISQKQLGQFFGWGDRTIRRLRADGYLIPGQHFRLKTPESNVLLYDVEAIDRVSRSWLPSEPLLQAFDTPAQT